MFIIIPNEYTPEARRLAPVGSRRQANLWDWANVQIMRIISTYVDEIDNIYTFMLIKLDKIFIFFMSLAKIKNLMSRKM